MKSSRHGAVRCNFSAGFSCSGVAPAGHAASTSGSDCGWQVRQARLMFSDRRRPPPRGGSEFCHASYCAFMMRQLAPTFGSEPMWARPRVREQKRERPFRR